jgi:1-acyl-sn-glycerol-3-phosphate acyltransferase
MPSELRNGTSSSTFDYPSPLVIGFLRYFGWTISKIFWRLTFHHTENIPIDPGRGLIIASNHQSYFDPFWICFPVRRRMRFMAWDKAFEWPVIGPMIKYLGAFPVSLERHGLRASFLEARKCLGEGATLIVFPEGSRCFADGRLLPFKNGAVRLAIETGCDILPVTIRGANRVWSQGMRFPLPNKVEITYHPVLRSPALEADRDPQDFVREQTDYLKRIIEGPLIGGAD